MSAATALSLTINARTLRDRLTTTVAALDVTRGSSEHLQLKTNLRWLRLVAGPHESEVHSLSVCLGPNADADILRGQAGIKFTGREGTVQGTGEDVAIPWSQARLA